MRKRLEMAWLSGLVLVGACWAESRDLRDELKALTADTGISVAMFDDGKLSRWSASDGWNDVVLPLALGHHWSEDGMVSPDGTLAAFQYWEVKPCPSSKNCDVKEPYFLVIARTDGGGILKYPQIVQPSYMCWNRDSSKLAMVAQAEDSTHRQLIVLHLDRGRTERVADGETVAVTPQCWSPDGRRLVYFAGEKSSVGRGAIRILDTETHESRELLRGGPDCSGKIMCANPYPTWSPDGEWIAYLMGKTYWVIHPSGDGKKRLFRRSGALSPLQWSPDMRFALYANCCALRDTWQCMCEIGRIHVRRIADNSDIEISADGFQNMFSPRWTWIQSKP